MKINLYDFDKTIYHGDSSTDFFFYSIMKYPKIIKRIPKIIYYGILCGLHLKTKTEMKQVIFSFLKDIPDIDTHVNSFWSTHSQYIKKFYLDKKHDDDVIISASPEFLLSGICKSLGVKKLIGTKVDKHTGVFNGLNCHDEEKVKRLNKVYTDYKVMESYSDSKSDIPILRLAKKQFIVKGEKLIPVNYK